MKRWHSRSVFGLLTAGILALALSQVTALEEAKRGTSAGSLEVFLAFTEEHDADFYAEDAEFHVMGQPEPYRGRKAIRQALATFYGGAFTDTDPVHRTIVADGNIVVLEFVYHGTNTGEFAGLPATNQRVSVPMLGIYEIEDGYIQRGRLYFDFATMMRQLGHME